MSTTLSPATPTEAIDEGRERHLRDAAAAVLEGYQVAHPDDPEQAAEMTVRAAMDVLDEFKPSRARRGRVFLTDLSAPPGPGVDMAVPFRIVARRDWMPLDEQKRGAFLAIVREATPTPPPEPTPSTARGPHSRVADAGPSLSRLRARPR